MGKPITQRSLAHALSIIGEAGDRGFEYDAAINGLVSKRYVSAKCRWTTTSSPSFDWRDFKYHMSYAAKGGFIETEKGLNEIARGELPYPAKTLHLTLKGWDHVERFDRTLIGSWVANISENVPTIIVTLITAVALMVFGL